MSDSTHRRDTIATALHDLREQLPPSERRVVRTLLAGYPVSGIGTLAELAERARVSGPTVLRLVNRLGFTGFGDFQRALKSEAEARLATVADSMPAPSTRPDDHLVKTLLLEGSASISADAEAVLADEIDDVVRIATRSRDVAIMGGWLSYIFALYFFTQLDLMRPRCHYVGSSVSSRARELANLGRNDALIVFDTRPYTFATQQLCTWVRRRGARIVLFTDGWLSPVSKIASSVLVARTASSSSPFDLSAPLCALLDGILAAIAEQLGDSARRRSAQAEALLEGWMWQPGDLGPER